VDNKIPIGYRALSVGALIVVKLDHPGYLNKYYTVLRMRGNYVEACVEARGELGGICAFPIEWVREISLLDSMKLDAGEGLDVE